MFDQYPRPRTRINEKIIKQDLRFPFSIHATQILHRSVIDAQSFPFIASDQVNTNSIDEIVQGEETFGVNLNI